MSAGSSGSGTRLHDATVHDMSRACDWEGDGCLLDIGESFIVSNCDGSLGIVCCFAISWCPEGSFIVSLALKVVVPAHVK